MAASRGITPLRPLLRERYDAGGSAVGNAAGSAGGNDAATFAGGGEQQIGEQRHRLTALLITEPHQARLQQLEVSSLGQSLRDRQRSQNRYQRRSR